MGERGQIIVDGVYLYTHWYGDVLTKILKQAMIRGMSRWNDSAYLRRIIFCEMLLVEENIEDSLKEVIGFGIDTNLYFNDYPVLIVDTKTQTITERNVVEQNKKPVLGNIIGRWTFNQFVERKDGE